MDFDMNNNVATPESVWAFLLEIAERQNENAKQWKENAKQWKTEMVDLAERQKETDKQLKENSILIKENSIQIKAMNEMYGGMGNSNGMFAEEFFINSIKSGDKKLFGEQFDECECYSRRNLKNKQTKGEQDLFLYNGNAVAIIEIKYKARREDIQKLINKPPIFKILYPQYQSHRIYLGLAAMSFEEHVEDDTIKEGIAIIKQVGDDIIINDKNLKVF